MGKQVDVRRATEADADAIQRFVRETYGDEAPYKGPDRWRWQFVNSPFHPADDSAPSVWIAVDDARVVGQIAVQDGRLQLGSDLLDAGWIVDVMVHPDYRGLRLSHQIHDAIMLERGILVTLTMAPATRRVAERAECLTLGPTGRFIQPRRVSGAGLRRWLAHKAQMRPDIAWALNLFRASYVGPTLLAVFLRAATAVRRRSGEPASTQGRRLEEVSRFPESYDEFWESAAPTFPALFERTAEFLNWRFCDCPELEYRKFVLYGSDGAPCGHLVTRLATQVELRVGVIVDMFARADDTTSLSALLAAAEEVLAPAEFLEAAASTPAWQDALSAAGFFQTHIMRPTVVVRDPGLKARIASMLDDWHFTKADHDWDQIHPA